MTVSPLQILREKFGYDSFRLEQEAVINSVLQKRDTFVLMPTGGGKSLCYQIPALLFDGLTVVISPLIALMKDQVDALRVNGITAAFLNSTQSFSEQNGVLNKIKSNELKLLYLAPESNYIKQLAPFQVSLVAIDEAHCISHWGHDFRPDYLALAQFKKSLPNVPIIALTATADKLTRSDIVEKLGLSNPQIFISSFNRPNIRYLVDAKRDSYGKLLEFLEKRKNDSGIIYCLSRASTESLADDLQRNGFKALPYHAGLDKDLRTKHQELFLRDDIKIIVATIAFGMGIDKSNVRFVVHMDLPKNIESYYQETGRAGRDGLDSEALLFYTFADVVKMKKFVEIEGNAEQTEIYSRKLDQMADYGALSTCRRKFLLNYFDESADTYCGNCDICLTKVERTDGTISTQKILSAVVRLQERFGVNYVIDFLRGSGSSKIREEHKEIKTFGVGADMSKDFWRDVVTDLIAQGYLKKSDGEYPVLQLTEKSDGVLKGKVKVMITKSKELQVEVSESRSQPYEDALLQRLKDLRRAIANEENVPAYIVLSDATLQELATYLPHNRDEFYKISGFGEVKIERYGKRFREVVAEYCREHNLQSRIHLKTPKRQRKRKESTTSDTRQQSYHLYKQGMSINDIAAQRNLTQQTIEGHLAAFVEKGLLPITEFVDNDRLEKIRKVIEEQQTVALTPVREALGEDYSFGEIRLVMAHVEWMKLNS